MELIGDSQMVAPMTELTRYHARYSGTISQGILNVYKE